MMPQTDPTPRGSILAFVDADMRIHPGTFDAIERAVASDRIVGGATGVTLDRWSAGLVVTFAVLIPFVWITRLKGVKAIASTRKFDEHGDWHYLTLLPRIALGWGLGRPSALRAIERYWYDPRR